MVRPLGLLGRSEPSRRWIALPPAAAQAHTVVYGIARLPKSKKKQSLRDRFELVKSELQRADWTDAVSEAFGQIKAALARKGTPIEDFDAAIAAHAKARDATLVTANLSQMVRIAGLRIEDWSKEA